jgi:Uncharacterized protein conserved in bacteria (DUF2263)
MASQGGSQHGNSRPSKPQYSQRQAANAATAKETRHILPDIMQKLPHLAPSKSESLHLNYLLPLKPADCPKRTESGKVTIKVVYSDTFKAAISLASTAGTGAGRVVVLNMASHSNPGGGWLGGASAQEEALSYKKLLVAIAASAILPLRAAHGPVYA